MVNDWQLFFRFATAFNEFLNTTITEGEARERVRRMLAAREENLLRLIRTAVFEHARSPYLALCRNAHVELGDIQNLIARDGLESALDQLARAGVFVTVDEFRGLRPIRRGTFELPVDARDFDNPQARRHLDNQSGGSTGAPRRMAFDLTLAATTAPIEMVFLIDAGLFRRPMAVFRTAPPGIAGFIKTLYQLRMGHFVERWFSEKKLTYGPLGWRHSAFMLYAHLWARVRRKRLPLPAFTPLEDAHRVAEWLAQKKAEGTPGVLDVVTSVGVRVARAALDRGLDISGSAFRVGSEPFTEARADVCAAAGVRVFPHYAMSEAGMIAMACASPAVPDEMHLLTHRVAAIQRPHRVADGETVVDAFHYTTLLPSASRVLLNLESGDFGVMRRSTCGCGLCRVGMDTTIHSVRSYEKLTSAGVAFMGTDLYTLVERALPAAFGGGPSDYQVIEEDIEGLPHVSIVVSPRVGPVDHARVVAAVVDFLSSRNAAHRMMAQSLRHGAHLGVIRREPYVTSASKIQPLHVLRPGNASDRAAR
ncbi:MAG: hypothetical protein AB7Q29_11920 [Vicinamibacterales bacterium]